MFRKASGCESAQCPEVAFIRAAGCDAGTCAEVHVGEDVVLFRDSEDPDTVVRVKKESWRVFINGAKAGEFDV